MLKPGAILLVLSVVVCFPAVCRADSVTVNGITLTLTTTNLSVLEGNSLTLTYTLDNNSGFSQFIGGFLSGFGVRSGDVSDGVGNPTLDSGNCPTLFADKASCTFTWTFPPTSPSDPGETDGNNGVDPFSVTVTLCSDTCPLAGTTLTLDDTITVNDPPVPPVPEPAALLLVSVGLLCVGPLVRRRFARG